MLPGPVKPGLIPLHADPGDDIVALEGWRYLTAWVFEPLPFLLLVLSAGLYLWGVRVLHRRGDKWPPSRTIAFLLPGLGSVAIATFSFLGAYDTVLFWLHMVQHMLLNMIAPVFLALGAPVTLALRTLPKQPRDALLRLLHSGLAKVALFPPLTTFLMVATPVALYMTPWYEATLRNDLLHDGLHFWLLFVGCLFFVPLLAIDPVPIKMPYPIRLLLFFLTMPFHAFLGVTIMGSEKLIAEDWYVGFERGWGLSPLDDQTWAGALMWATGDLTMLSAMAAIFLQWIKDSKKEARRADRLADRREAAEARRVRVAGGVPVGYDAQQDPPHEAAPGGLEDKDDDE